LGDEVQIVLEDITHMGQEAQIVVETFVLGSRIILDFVILFFEDTNSLDSVINVKFRLNFDIMLKGHKILELLLLILLDFFFIHFIHVCGI